jgi:hypothetical protein
MKKSTAVASSEKQPVVVVAVMWYAAGGNRIVTTSHGEKTVTPGARRLGRPCHRPTEVAMPLM